MTENLLYAIGTLSNWAGWLLAIGAVLLGAKILLKDPAIDPARAGSRLAISAGAAGVLLALSLILPMKPDPAATAAAVAGTWRLPLVWFVLPWSAWLTVVSVGFLIGRGLQAGMALDSVERMDRLKAVGAWFVAGLVFVFLYRGDPDNKITILKGGIGFSPTTVIAIILLAVAAIFAMVYSNRSATTKGWAKVIVTQITLVVGAIVFGIPFAFLVITSFKEDRDMSSASGIIWIPKVQETVPYFDKQDPLYEADYEGQTVQGAILERHPDGTVKVDIQKPMAIRGTTFEAPFSKLKEIAKDVPVVSGTFNGTAFVGNVVETRDDGRRRVAFTSPATLKGQESIFNMSDLDPVRHVGLRTQNYSDALDFLPPETNRGLVYLKNTLIIVIFSVIGTLLSSSIVAYAFSRLSFPGRDILFNVLLATMMLPGAVTLMPQFLIFRWFGWIDTLLPLWVPAFFGSAFNIFLLRQFFMQIPMELEDAAKIDGCSYPKAFWNIMMPQIKPALAVIAIWTFMGAWNNFMGPLIYINSPENMPLSYALKLFQGDRGGEPALLMAFSTLTMLPVLALFFFCQKYFVEGVTLSGLGGR